METVTSRELERKKDFIKKLIPGVIFLVGDEKEIMVLYNFYKKLEKNLPFMLEDCMLLESNYYQLIKICFRFNSTKFFKILIENLNFSHYRYIITEDCLRSKKYDLLQVLSNRINLYSYLDDYLYYVNNNIVDIISNSKFNPNVLATFESIKILSKFSYIKEYRDLLLKNKNTNKKYLYIIDILCGLKHNYLNIFENKDVKNLEITDCIKNIILNKIITSNNSSLKDKIFSSNIDIYINYLDIINKR